MNETELWERCVAFHGHSCGGLAIGFRAALYAKELLGLSFSSDEQVVCLSENDACGVDAIQVVLGCSVGKGNLLFRLRGKQAFSFYQRKTGQSVRLLLNPRPEGMSREEALVYYRNTPADELFSIKEVTVPLPPEAKLFGSHACAHCGECTAEAFLRIQDGQFLCLDCAEDYRRLNL